MTFSPLGAYIPGDSLLHRLRPGVKLCALFVFATLAIAFRAAPSAVVSLAFSLALCLGAGMRARALLRTVTRFAIVGALLLAFQWWQHGWEQGVAVVGTLFALILAASALTASTSVDDMLDTLLWALHPLRRLGVHPERVALAFSLVLRLIPTLIELVTDTREAAKARGLERNPRALLTPFVVRSVAHAHDVGAALQARGIGDDDAAHTVG